MKGDCKSLLKFHEYINKKVKAHGQPISFPELTEINSAESLLPHKGPCIFKQQNDLKVPA